MRNMMRWLLSLPQPWKLLSFVAWKSPLLGSSPVLASHPVSMRRLAMVQTP